ncbi:LysR family transcriptional regulator [Nitrospirillum sp. BR 11828]|uniref:LysR family transcriptional regulator n=1 Tax=Nitrospirillum sp. BR 11828 TaxID=3104325 RepID=UPI002ACA820F|nr:LysR family transcriptional regulator [Nitrospirillum sp. BR 11828]MDZ5650035.1 LysR family transcriptional regulator [Nitrospirillum sp. BR 11828]
MELRDLEYFLAVVDTGSFTVAARRRGLSQQALSKSLARLEDELGVVLLERTPKGVMVTRMGDSLLQHARTMLSEVAVFRRDLDVALGRSANRFALGMSPVASAGIGARAVIRLQRRYPQLRMRIEGGVKADFTRLLLSGDLELAVTTGTEDVDPQIMVTAIGLERWLVVARRGNPILTKARSIGDLAGADWLFGKLPDDLDLSVDQEFAAAGLEPIQAQISTVSIPFALSMLAATDLLALLPQSLVTDHPGLMGRDLAQGRWTTPLIAMRRRRAAISPATADLMDILKDEAQRLASDAFP